MDEFLRDISVSVFKEWILFQKYNEYQINFNQEDPDKIYITTEYGNGTIIFNDHNIILCHEIIPFEIFNFKE